MDVSAWYRGELTSRKTIAIFGSAKSHLGLARGMDTTLVRHGVSTTSFTPFNAADPLQWSAGLLVRQARALAGSIPAAWLTTTTPYVSSLRCIWFGALTARESLSLNPL